MSNDNLPNELTKPGQATRQNGKLGNWITGWLEGTPGVVMLLLVGVLGNLAVWLAYVEDEISLADAIASEGVIIAVVFGIPALRAALHHEEHLAGVSANLSDVSASVLTRTLGVFPDFFRYVPPLLSRAEHSVRIMCDNPGYAIVSDGGVFDSYIAELKRCIGKPDAMHDFTVDLMFLDAAEREELHRDQSPEAAWEKRRVDQQGQLESFLARASRLCNPDQDRDEIVSENVAALTFEAYIARLKEVNNEILTRHLYGARRRVLQFRDSDGNARASASGPSIYFWMRDDKEAIFVIVPLGKVPGPGREVAFTTQDPTMITALRGVFSRYDADSIPVHDGSSTAVTTVNEAAC